MIAGVEDAVHTFFHTGELFAEQNAPFAQEAT
jgi:hypothetical protein